MTDSLDLIDGIAALIVAGVPGTAYNTTGTYTTGQVGIFNMLVPASPDETVTLTWVPQVEHPSMPISTGLFQVRVRGAAHKPRRPVQLLDQIGALFLGGINIQITATLSIMQVLGRVRAPLGMDESYRWDWTDNYTLQLSTTPTVVRPSGGNW